MKRDPRVEAYIAKAAPALQPILEHVRTRVGETIPEAEETTKWGGPAYTLGGKLLLLTHAFKGHAALSFWREAELLGERQNKDAMGQFGRITSVDQLPSDKEFERLLREAVTLSKEARAPRQPKHPATPREPHPDFTAALEKSPKAKAAYDAFAPSHRREYCEWIAEGKRGETRAKRIATTIEWLSEGKKRNWKYERP
ncbi:MAG: YdeI/OmpD-associated family protein [Sphingomicrobium sp.]